MQPRLKNSKKWTAFPQEYTTQIKDVFEQNFSEQKGKRQFVVEGRIFTNEIILRVGLSAAGELKQDNFEVSVDYNRDEKEAILQMNHCVDALASMVMDYFENQNDDFPRQWAAFPFQDTTVYLQYSSVNSTLEAEADKILGLANGSLLNDVPEDETDADSETDPEDNQPRMFRKLH
jgi:hypothetical protein